MNYKTFLITLLWLTIVLVSGCKSTKYTTETLPETQLIFGNGGGFTGMVSEYLMLQNGQLFEKKAGAKQFAELGKIKKKEALSLFAQLDSLSFTSIEMNKPGNTYQFIHLLAPEVDHKLTWGKSDYEADTAVVSLYNKLMEKVKKEQ